MKQVVVLLLLLLCLSGCWFNRDYPTTEMTRAAVVRVAAEYIGYVLLKNADQLDGLILWSDYADNKGGMLNRVQYFKQLASLPKLPNDNSNPLTGLDVHDLDVRGNDADITLVKHGVDDAEKIDVSLTWVGQGWLVVNDSLFGPGEYLEKIAAAKQSG